MDWDNIRIFLAIARAGHLLGAARRLRLNHATVARRLNALEMALQTRLFVRRPSGCSLTDEGQRLLSHAERMETEMAIGCSSVGHTEISVDGTVRIGAPDGFGIVFLAPRLGRLKALYPDLLVQMVPVSPDFSLARRDADLAITIGRPEAGRLISRKLTDYSFGLFAARDYLQRNGTPQDHSDLARHTRIGGVYDTLYSLYFGQDLISDWQPDIEISTTLGRAEAVAGGAGIGILQHFIARKYDNLVEISTDRAISRSYWITIHEDLRDIRRISAVSDFIAAEVKADLRAFQRS